MSKHTPGPWEVNGVQEHNPCPTVCAVHKPEWDYRDKYWLCVMQDHTREKEAVIANYANARLIAAAPDLLEACKAAFKAIDEQQDYHYVGLNVLPRLIAAIAKARGES